MTLNKPFLLLFVGVMTMIPTWGKNVFDSENTIVETPDTKNEVGLRVVNTAMKYLGVGYRKGANGPKSFDCSGFTRFVYRQKNIPLTRTSITQYHEGKPIRKIADLKPGDLVFFTGSRLTGTVGHVGIVKELNADSSDFSFVHASRTGVKVDVLSSAYYKKRYMGARRVL